MKTIRIILIMLAFAAICVNVFGQQKTYSFKVETFGSGKKAMVLIPGFACSGVVWNDTMYPFFKEYTCYALTMPGFAGQPAEASPSFKGWEKEIADFIIDKKLNKPVIIGHSMGGGLALAIAADYPDLPSKIVIVDALPCLAAARNPSFKAKADNDCSAMVDMMMKQPDSSFKNQQEMTMRMLMDDPTHREQVVQWSLNSDRKTFATMYCDFMNTDLRESIAAIKCPALVLLENYFTNMKPVIESQYSKLKTAQLAYATKGKHFIMYDDPEWYNQQLSAFIK